MGNRQTAESFVFVEEEHLRLRYRPLVGNGVQLRSHADCKHLDCISYKEGTDFIVDYENGWIRRTQGSVIPDWSQHPLHGIDDFDHTLYEDYSNRNYTVYADYSYAASEEEIEKRMVESKVAGSLDKWLNKLRTGVETVYIVYGDSISVGGEASEQKFTYFHRFAEHVTDLYPNGQIKILNRAVGGETSEGGISRVEIDVIAHQPDLVTIGYGMNDQNKYDTGNGVSLADFEQNFRGMIQAIRQGGDSDIVLVTPCEPNPLWRHTSGQIHEYANVIRRLGEEYGLCVADAHALWRQELMAGKTSESLLLNNINHPNDYGHDIYYRAFQLMLQKLGDF